MNVKIKNNPQNLNSEEFSFFFAQTHILVVKEVNSNHGDGGYIKL